MPQNIQMAAFILGAVLILLAITVGGFRIFGAEMSGAAGRWSRVIAGLAGAALIAYALAPAKPAGHDGGNSTVPQSPPQQPPQPGRVVMGPLEQATNRQGDDFDAYGKDAANAELCAEMCRVDADCVAMTYVIPYRRCWMKTAVPPATRDANMISALKLQPKG